MDAARLSLDALSGALFAPNLLLLEARRHSGIEIAELVGHCRTRNVGMVLTWTHAGPIRPGRGVTVWLRPGAPGVPLETAVRNLDVPLLLGLLVAQAWDTPLQICTVVADPRDRDGAAAFVATVARAARLPSDTTTYAFAGPFLDSLQAPPKASLNLFGMPDLVDPARLAAIAAGVGGDCLFILDSGDASAIA